MSDPVCVVECMGKKHHTIVQPKTTICTWDHLMFFELNVLPGEFFTGKVILKQTNQQLAFFN